MCVKCLSTDLSWVQLKNRGKLLTYTVIYVAPQQFESIMPYACGIIELEDGPRLPGLIKDTNFEEMKIGTELEVDFETEPIHEWPNWPRYFFRPPEQR